MAQGKSSVLVLSLDANVNPDELWGQLLDELRIKFDVVLAKSAEQVVDHLSFALSLTAAVLVMDPLITDCRNYTVLRMINIYARTGGVVVLGGTFGSFKDHKELYRFLKEDWRMPWYPMKYSRSHPHNINESSELEKLNHGVCLPPACNISAWQLYSVPIPEMVYTPALPSPHAQAVSIAFGKFGRGYSGYVGEVDPQEASRKAIIAMCNIFSPFTPTRFSLCKRPTLGPSETLHPYHCTFLRAGKRHTLVRKPSENRRIALDTIDGY